MLLDSHVDEFNGEVFDSGDEPYAKQWDYIKRDYNLNRGEKDEVLEDVDTDKHAEEELDDGKVVKTHKIGKKVEHKCGQDQLEPSPMVRSRHRAADDTEVVL